MEPGEPKQNYGLSSSVEVESVQSVNNGSTLSTPSRTASTLSTNTQSTVLSSSMTMFASAASVSSMEVSSPQTPISSANSVDDGPAPVTSTSTINDGPTPATSTFSINDGPTPVTSTDSINFDDIPPVPRSAEERPMTTAEGSSIFLWLYEEPFEFGVLPQTCKQMNLGILQKTALYWKEKSLFPRMTLANWIHTATSKMLLSYSLACSYFQMFDTITRPSERFEYDGNWDITAQRIYSNYNDVRYLSRTKITDPISLKVKQDIQDVIINTPQFLMFLYIQHWDRPFAKLNNAQEDDAWPRAKESVTSDTNLAIEKLYWEPRCMKFFQLHIFEILTFLNLGERNPDRLKFEILQGLDLIFLAAHANKKAYSSLEKLIQDDEETSAAVGFSPYDNCVSKHMFARWVKSHLYPNPWSLRSSAIVMKTIDVSTGSWSAFPVSEFNRVWHNNQKPPQMWVIISQVNEQVFCYDKFKPYTSLKIHRCSDSYIYIPGAFRYVTIEKCRNTTVSMGPVARVIRIVSCERLKFHGIGRLIIIKDCRSSDFYLMCPNPPILCGTKNKNIKLAPYNTFYSSLDYDLKCVVISTEASNLVTNPVELGFDGWPKENCQDKNYQLIKPDDYRMMPFPIETEGAIKDMPFALPKDYAQVVKETEVNTDMAKTTITESSSKLSETESAHLKRIIHARFLAWLQANNHQKLLTGLDNLDEEERFKSQPKSASRSSASAYETQGATEATIVNLVKKLVEGGPEGPSTTEC